MKKFLLSGALVASLLLSAQQAYGQDGGAGRGVAPAREKKQFLLRLIPPRTTFADDMTTPEMKVMQEDGLYWKAQFAKGSVLLLGPVTDVKGGYGMVVLETASEEEAKALAQNDPGVKAGVSKWELAPMRVFLVKK